MKSASVRLLSASASTEHPFNLGNFLRHLARLCARIPAEQLPESFYPS
jgi:hypothetical protein